MVSSAIAVPFEEYSPEKGSGFPVAVNRTNNERLKSPKFPSFVWCAYAEEASQCSFYKVKEGGMPIPCIHVEGKKGILCATCERLYETEIENVLHIYNAPSRQAVAKFFAACSCASPLFAP